MLRKHKKMTQQQLAKHMGIHSNTISGWECGNNLPDSKGVVLELAHQLRLDEQETRQLLEASLTAISPYWLVPYPRNPFFTGREQALQQLHATLSHERAAILSQSYALSGLGGIGKTQIALEYAYRYVNEYSAIFWIIAETRESILSSYTLIADVLNLPSKQEQHQEKVVTDVTRWLTTHNGWLVILDNVEDPIHVKDILPATRYGSLLFTSRRQALGLAAQTLDLAPMTLDEGMRFLLYRARRLDSMSSSASLPSTEKTLAREIVAAMDGLPLALDQAGGYIEATQCSLSDYLRLLQFSQLRLLDERDVHREHPGSVLRTFALIFEQLEQKSILAADLLTVCAFLAPEAIPEAFFLEGASYLGLTFETLASDALIFQDTIKVVLSYSLFQRNPNTHTITIHRLVQAVLKGKLAETTQRTWIGRITRAMNWLFPSDDEIQADYWQICEQLLPHALVCITLWEQWKEDETIYITLMQHIATYLSKRGRFAEAEPLYLRVLAIEEQILGTEHPLVATSLNGLATLYREQGKHKEAESLYLQSLAIEEQILGTEHPLVATSLDNLATLYRKQGKYTMAEPLYLQALCIFEQALGPKHLQIASPLTNLGILYTDQGRNAEAESVYQRALHIREQNLGPEHRQIAYPLIGLANLYEKQGKDTQAELLYQRALHIFEQVLGRAHPQVAYPLNNLAELYMKQGKYREAEPLYQQALSIVEQLGEGHLLVAYPLDGLATLYREQGDYGQAELLYHQALSIFELQSGQEHPNTAAVIYHLAQLQETQGKNEEALLWYMRALAIQKQVLGTHHIDTIETHKRLISLLHTMQRHDEIAQLSLTGVCG